MHSIYEENETLVWRGEDFALHIIYALNKSAFFNFSKFSFIFFCSYPFGLQSISVPYEHYLEQMACFTEWGGMNEIRAISLLYKRDVIIFNGQKQTVENVTNGGFDQNLLLCYTPPKQYETVLSLLYVKKAAYCQCMWTFSLVYYGGRKISDFFIVIFLFLALVYETLYECVFNMTGITHTADKMLHDRNNEFRHDRFFHRENLEIRE